MLIVDAHEDITWNMLCLGRDYRQSVQAIREREGHKKAPEYGNTTLGLDAWLAGRVAVIFSTIFTSPIEHQFGSWDIVTYQNTQEAYDWASRQIDMYHQLADEHPNFQVIGSQDDLKGVLASWKEEDQPDEERRIGLVPLMEGAEPIIEPEQVEEWYERGLRIVGLAWEATRYAGGTHTPGPLTSEGYALLEVMTDLGMVLDLSHLAEQAYFQALDAYEGVLIASHANPRRFLPTSRGLSDEMIDMLAERGGVVGIVPYNLFLKPGWMAGDRKETVKLAAVVDAIDHVCQVTGSADHVGIGSDFDGGFGYEHIPAEMNTVADLRKLIAPLGERGYTEDQIESILGGNWLRILRRSLPG